MLAIYCRHSKQKEESKDTSIPTQEKYGIELAKRLEMPYKTFIDRGLSGTNSKNRDAMQEMLDEIRNNKITAVYAYDQERIERETSFWLEFCTIVIKNNVKYYENSKEIDLTDPSNIMSTTMKSAFSTYYAAQTSIKVKESIIRNAEKGKTRGLLPYGYEKDKDGFVVIVPSQAEVVKRIFDLSLSGLGTYSISNILNEENIPTKFNSFKGKITKKGDKYQGERKFNKSEVKWRGNVIYDMILNESYKGIKRVGKIVIDIPPIISTSKWEKTNKNLEKNKKIVGPKTQYHYLLNGLVTCSHCERPMVGKKRLKGNDYAYKCSGKNYPNPSCNESRGISIPKLETFIIKHLFEYQDLSNFLLNLPENDSEVNSLKKKLEKKVKELEHVRTVISNTDILLVSAPPNRANRFIKILDENEKKETLLSDTIEFLEQRILTSDKKERDKKLQKAMHGYSKKLTFEQIKDLVHSIIEEIVIKHCKKKVGESGFSHHMVYIKYRGFDEELIVSTKNYLALHWMGMFYRNTKGVRTMNTEKIIIDWDKVATQETIEMPISSYVLTIKEEELIHFD